VADKVTDPVSKHSRTQIDYALLQFFVWNTSQTAQRIISPSTAHIVHEFVIVSLTARDIHRCLGRAGLHDRATKESFAVTSVSDHLATNANAARTLPPTAFDDYRERCVVGGEG